ncbi:MAG TPA: hypothetical protein VGD54_05850, partial [Steroidobacteraceae bacterium]
MHKFQLRKPILAAIGGCAAICASPGIVLADNAQDIQQLKDQVRAMQQKLDQLQATGPTPTVKNADTQPPDAPKRGETPALTWKGITVYGTVDIGVEYV